MTLCNCTECQRGDALPMHRQGIPGARQLLLETIPGQTVAYQAPEPERVQRSMDDFALFGGGLQPSLF